MFCPNCGASNIEGAKFCTSCGKALPSDTAQTQQAPIYDADPSAAYPGGYKANIKRRDIAVCIILSIVTCGIYSIVWMVNVVNELNLASGNERDTNGITVWLLGWVTCGIYALFWLYNAGDKVAEVRRRNGHEAGSDGVIYLVLALFGFGIVSYAMIQNDLNKVAAIA